MDVIASYVNEALGSSVLEITAALLALAYLILAIRRSLWCWLCALVSTAMYIVVMARSGLAMDTLLQVYYLIMAVYGYLEWRRGQDKSGELKIITWSWRQHAIAGLFVLVLTVVNAFALQKLAPFISSFSAEMGLGYVQVVRSPWLDSFVTWGSVLTTWMVARRVLENWLYWIVVDGIAAGLYYSRDLKATAVLFVIYLAMVVHGYVQWRHRAVLQTNLQMNPT